MTDEDFRKQQTSVIDSLLEKETHLHQESRNHWNHINSGYYDFDRSTYIKLELI